MNQTSLNNFLAAGFCAAMAMCSPQPAKIPTPVPVVSIDRTDSAAASDDAANEPRTDSATAVSEEALNPAAVVSSQVAQVTPPPFIPQPEPPKPQINPFPPGFQSVARPVTCQQQYRSCGPGGCGPAMSRPAIFRGRIFGRRR